MKFTTKRLFIGIRFENSKHQIEEFREKYLRILPVRFIPIKNLHVTLIPPWNEKNTENVKSLLLQQKNWVKPFYIEFTQVTFGPNKKHPRLIWAEGNPSRQLAVLKNSLEKLLNKSPLRRDFRLHMTLARFNQRDFKKFSIRKVEERISWRQKVTEFSLYESILQPGGVKYKILANISLV